MRMRDNIVRMSIPFGVIVVVGLGIFVRCSFVLHKNLWLDESLTFAHSQFSLHDLVLQKNAYWDYNHPPGYFLMIKFWSFFNTSEFFLRLPSVLFYVVGAYFLKKITDFFWPRYIALILLTYYSFHPLIVQLGTEVKMYSVMIGINIVIIYLLVRFFSRPKNWFVVNGLILLPALGFYIDYSAIWIIATIMVMAVFLIVRGHPLKSVLLTISISICLFIIPQIIVMMSHLDEIKFLTSTQHSSGDLRRLGLGLFAMYTGLAHWAWESGQFKVIIFNPITGFAQKITGLAQSSMMSLVLFGPMVSMLLFFYTSIATRGKKSLLYLMTFVGMSLPIVIPILFYFSGQNVIHVRNQIQVVLFMILAMGLMLDRFKLSNHVKIASGILFIVIFGSFFHAIRNDYVKTEIDWKKVRRQAENGCNVVYFGQPKQGNTPFHEMSPFTDYYSRYPYPIFSKTLMIETKKQVEFSQRNNFSGCVLTFVGAPVYEEVMNEYCLERRCEKYYFY